MAQVICNGGGNMKYTTGHPPGESQVSKMGERHFGIGCSKEQPFL